MKLKLSIVCMLIVVTLAVCPSGAQASEDGIEVGRRPEQGVRANFSPTRLFDFEYYKAIFHKTYSGFLEELVRKKYFLSRAFRAFISAIKYKYRKSRFYLALNAMSDWTKEDIKKSENKVLSKAMLDTISKVKDVKKSGPVQDEPADDLPNLLPDDVDEVERDLKAIADSTQPAELDYDELRRATDQSGSSRRTKREIRNTRDLPIEKLIDTGSDARLIPEAARRLTNDVPGNDIEYEPFNLPNLGLSQTVEPVKVWEKKPSIPSKLAPESTGSLENVINDLKNEDLIGQSDQQEKSLGANEQLPDEVFVDLRDTGCFTLPRDQGKCGSCWAFAGITLFEYFNCKTTGKLVPFSEQYLVDCGHYVVGFGCEGGVDVAAAHFVSNFGLELRAHYPYSMHENQCPYTESTNLKQTGYIRFEFKDVVAIDVELWPEYIGKAPLSVPIKTTRSLREYGGGVFGWGCEEKHGGHAVVLVGHGREDGEEYWLIRNSYSVGWGEGGYGKLAKKANCIMYNHGIAFATADGENHNYEIRNNQLHDSSVIENYFAHMSLPHPEYIQRLLIETWREKYATNRE